MTHYYFSKGKLYEIDRMPPVRELLEETETFNSRLNKFTSYLSTLTPIPCEGFTEEGVYPEDRIEWRYETRRTIELDWIPANKDFYDRCIDSHRRKVAVLKEDNGLNLPNDLKVAYLPSVDSPEPTAAIEIQSVAEALALIIGKSDIAFWSDRKEAKHDALYHILQLAKDAYKLTFSPLPKTDEDAADKYANRNRATLEGNESEIRVNAFLAGCQHVRGQQGTITELIELIDRSGYYPYKDKWTWEGCLPGQELTAIDMLKAIVEPLLHPAQQGDAVAYRTYSLLFLSFVNDGFTKVAQNGYRLNVDKDSIRARTYTSHELWNLFKETNEYKEYARPGNLQQGEEIEDAYQGWLRKDGEPTASDFKNYLKQHYHITPKTQQP